MSRDLAFTIFAIGIVASVVFWAAFRLGERLLRWYIRRRADRFADRDLR